MAVPNQSGNTDNFQVGDRSGDSSSRNQSNLSSNVWQEMKASSLDQAPAAANKQNDALVFDDIYACTSKESTPLKNIKDIKDVAEKNFDKIDADGDGFLSKGELEKAQEDKCLNEGEKKALEILAKHEEGMSELSNDELGSESNGISKADLKEFDTKYDEYKTAEDMSYYGNGDFDKIDTDGDGFMSADELDKAIEADQDKSSEKHKALVNIRKNYDQLVSVENDEWGPENNGVSHRDLLGNAIDNSGGAGGFLDDPVLRVSMNNDRMEYEMSKRRSPFSR